MPAGGNAGAAVETGSPSHDAGRHANNPFVVVFGTIVLIVVGLAFLASLLNIWPVVDVAATSGTQATARHTVRLLFALVTVKVTASTALLLLVMAAGGLGSMIQAATSFGDFVGNRRFYSSWVPWYLMRIVVGVLLALVLYFAFRGGFFSGNSPTSAVNPYGIAALAALAGLFSKQATDKLREVFETLFRVSSTGGDAQRKDDLANVVPTLTAVDPPSLAVGSSVSKLTVRGAHFIKGATVVRINGIDQETGFVGPQELSVTVPADLVAQAGSLQVTVFNGPPGGGESKPPVVVAVTAGAPPAK
jgi:IPT/TIG domain-containing protein